MGDAILKGAMLVMLVLMLTAIPADATVSSVSITPANPVKGDTVVMNGMAGAGEAVPITITFHMAAPVKNGKFTYSLSSVDIPSPNSFTVIASNCKRLSVSASLTFLPFPYTLTSQKSGSTQTISQSGVPSGKYNIRIFGDAVDWTSPVMLTVRAWTKTTADASGRFSYSYDTSPVPAGVFEVDVGGIKKSIMLSEGSSVGSSSPTGGGGTGYTPVEPPTNVKHEVTDYILNVKKGEHIIHEFSKQETDVQGIEFDSLDYCNELMVKVQELKKIPSSVSTTPNGTVYKSLNIVVDMPLGESTIKNAQIHFRVERLWLENNSLNASWVMLYRYHAGQWSALNTTLTSEDDNYTYYTAHSGGFSLFTIAAQKKTNETTTTNETAPQVPTPTSAPPHSTPSAGGIALVAALTCAYVLIRRG